MRSTFVVALILTVVPPKLTAVSVDSLLRSITERPETEWPLVVEFVEESVVVVALKETGVPLPKRLKA